MVKQFLKLGGGEIQKKFHYSKNPVAIGNVDVNKIMSDVFASVFHRIQGRSKS